MKCTTRSLLALSLVLLLCGSAFASDVFNAKGSAVAPGLMLRDRGDLYDYVEFYISNITESNVTCRVTAYDNDGIDVTATYGRVYTKGHVVIPTTEPGVFEIPANSTRMFQLHKEGIKTPIHGYAVIEWTSPENKRKALIASGRRFRGRSDRTHSSTLPVNNGQPF